MCDRIIHSVTLDERHRSTALLAEYKLSCTPLQRAIFGVQLLPKRSFLVLQQVLWNSMSKRPIVTVYTDQTTRYLSAVAVRRSFSSNCRTRRLTRQSVHRASAIGEASCSSHGTHHEVWVSSVAVEPPRDGRRDVRTQRRSSQMLRRRPSILSLPWSDSALWAANSQSRVRAQGFSAEGDGR